MTTPAHRPTSRAAGPTAFWRDGVSWVWLTAAVIVALTHQWVPEATWLMVHLVLLGALTHAILVWSMHFSSALLRARPDDGAARRHALRLKLLALGALGVLSTVPFAYWHATAPFAALVAAVVVWHGLELWRMVRAALPGRFRVTLWYYLAAAAFLPLGVTLGVLLATGPSADWFARLLMAHILVMVLGWVLLTVVGTLLTFWPTLLRVRMDERAERFARQGFPWLVSGVALAAVAALLGDPASVAVGLVVYVFGLVWWGRGLVAPLQRRPPREFAPLSVGLALVWLVVALCWVALRIAADGLAAFDAGPGNLSGIIAVGFAAQLLTGALSYLIPSVRGGGPSVVRAGQRELNRFATWRLVVINGALIVWLLPVGPWVRVTTSTLALVALAAYLPLALRAHRAAGAQAGALAEGAAPERIGPEGTPPVWTRRGLIGGAATLAIGAAAGVAVDPRAAGLPGWPSREPPVTPTGETTTIEVYTENMRFHPQTVMVPRGDVLKVIVTNRDEVDSHDLRIGDAQTPRIDPGRTQTLEYGPVGESIQGYCTIVGHRQLGMVFDIIVG